MGLVIDHVVLLLLMGVAVSGLVALTLTPLGRRRALAAAILWYGGCFVPLVLAQSERLPDPLRLSSAMDFAGAAGLHFSLWTYLAVALSVAVPRDDQTRNGVAAGRRRVIGGTVVFVAWCAWIVALEGRLTPYTVGLVGNVVLSAAGALVGVVLVALFRRRRSFDPLGGLLAGLGAASAAASGISPLAAAVLGFVSGAAAGLWGPRRAVPQLSAWIRSTGVGALLGLVAAGLLDVRSGFFFTGQPTAVIAQLVLIVITLALAAALGVVGGLIARRGRGGDTAASSDWHP